MEEKRFYTDSGIPLKPFYTSADLAGFTCQEYLGDPGVYPFTRGIHPEMYRKRPWTMRCLSGFGTSAEHKQRIKALDELGQQAPSLLFDLPTSMGYDSDDPRAAGEVGVCGTSMDTFQDFEEIFEDVPIENVSINFNDSSIAFLTLAMYVAIAEKRGIPLSNLRGTIQNDILMEYSTCHLVIFPPEPSLRLTADVIEFAQKNMPLFNPISIGATMREAGCNAIQEMGYCLANAIAYARACVERGMKVDEFAPRFSFMMFTHNDFFEEIAKLRAYRRIWAKITKERFGAREPKSWKFRFHVATGGSTLTAQEPLNNLIRATLQTLAAVLAGVQSLHTTPMDEALSIPTVESYQLSLRTQQIIAEESGVTRVVDPLGGSYYVEYLTNRLEEEAWKIIDKVEELGGAVEALKRGYIQREITQESQKKQRMMESGEKIVVGVNKYAKEEKLVTPINTFKHNPEWQRNQIERLRYIKRIRDKDKVQHTLAELREVALSNRNIIPFLVDAVRAYATVGEICGVLREEFGTYQVPNIF